MLGTIESKDRPRAKQPIMWILNVSGESLSLPGFARLRKVCHFDTTRLMRAGLLLHIACGLQVELEGVGPRALRI
jgi:hypothetical protein